MGNSKMNKSSKNNEKVQEQLESLMFHELSFKSLSQISLASSLQQIGSLTLKSCPIGGVGIRLLLQKDWLNLTNLTLYQCRLGNEGLVHLVKVRCKNLRNLDLLGNGISSIGCKVLTRGDWPDLQNLTLNKKHGSQRRVNKIEQFGLIYLKKMPVKAREAIKLTNEYNYWQQIIDRLDIL